MFIFILFHSAKDRTPIARDSSDGPPAYNALFPGIKDVRTQVRARQQNEGKSENVAVPLTLFDIICKSCKIVPSQRYKDYFLMHNIHVLMLVLNYNYDS